MPLFYHRNSDTLEGFYGEMPAEKAFSDDPIPTGETSSYKSTYENLPHHLKSCLDYICILFKNSYWEKRKVVRLLLAQGLIQEKPGEIIEDTAADIIDELICLEMLPEENYFKSMLCFSEFHAKSCLIEVEEHDFVAKAANSPIHALVSNNEDVPPNFKNLLIRSLFASSWRSASCHSYESVDFSQAYLQTVCALQFILVLDLYGNSEYLPDELENLVHLRYLGLQRTHIKKLPHTVGNLQNLQTLEVTHTKLRHLPVEILNIKQLRHLLLNDCMIDNGGIRVPRGIGTLVNLHTCAGVYVDAGFAIELSTLTHLRNLDVRNVSEDHASELFVSICKLENLVSLSLNAERTYLGTPLPELDALCPPPHLQELSLRGGLFEIPNWLASIENLTSLELRDSNLLENPSSVLQFLPKLKHLVLDHAYKAKIIGKEFCEAGGYPELETLLISSRDLVEWTEIVNGAFPSLKRLKFQSCHNLRFLPEGLQQLTTIQELCLFDSHGDLARTSKGAENYKIKHISNLRIY